MGLPACAWLMASAAPAAAQSARVHVSVAEGACPGADLIAQALAPLLGGDAALTFDRGERAAAGAADARGSHARVSDLGERYQVEIGSVQREFEDSARDCVERARVASVFIALNRNESPPPNPEPAPPPPPPPMPEPPAAPELPERPHFGVQLSFAAAYAPESSSSAPGAGAGVWFSNGALRFELSTGVLAATAIDLQAQSNVNGSVSLMRLPSTLSASYLLRAGSFRFGPTLGFALDLLRMHGTRVPDPQTALRANAGALAAIDTHARLAASWLALLRLSLSAFPRAYQLSVDGVGKLGRTPRLWLGATLGIEWQFR